MKQSLQFFLKVFLFLLLLIAADRIIGYILERGIYSYFGKEILESIGREAK